jgi:hypothetical protein
MTARANPAPATPAPAPAKENARDRFMRLAPPRTEAALKKISLLGNLAGSGYECQPAEAKQIVDALFEAVGEVKAKFDHRAGGRKRGFSFRRAA